MMKVMKVIFSDVTHLPALSSEMSSGWMPSFPDWMTAEKLSYLSPPRQVSYISETHKQSESERLKFWTEGNTWKGYDSRRKKEMWQ